MTEDKLQLFTTDELVQIVMKQQQMILIQDDLINQLQDGMNIIEKALRGELDD
jgi:hypothetical protein